MIWLLLRLSLIGLVLASPHQRTQPAELMFLCGLLSFDLLWVIQRRAPALRTVAALVFSALAGMTVLVFVIGGSLVSLGFFWPSLMLRLEDRPYAEQRLALVALQIALMVTAPLAEFPFADGLRMVPVFFSLLQIGSGRISRWANLGSLVWMLTVLVTAQLFSGETAALLARSTLLLGLPQLGLRVLNRD